MNVPLLRQIQRAIRSEPRRFDMGRFLTASDNSPCGTASCIAGHAFLLTYLKRNKKTFKDREFLTDFMISDLRPSECSISDQAVKLLGLTEKESVKLFYVDSWPQPYRDQYHKSWPSRGMQAKIAIKRIDFFIKSKGK